MSDDTAPKRWLNRTVLGTGLTSLLADLSYEAALCVLPGYLKKIGGGSAILGVMEGAADALASFVKLGSGWWSDRIDRRKPFAVVGYALTGVMPALMAMAVAWPLVLVARLLGWFGKGLRGPARDALLAASVPSEHRGKAFGLHRAGDTVGAVIGPLVAYGLLQRFEFSEFPERPVLWFAVLPGLLAAVAFLSLVREVRGAAVKRYRFGEAMRQLPLSFRRFLVAVGVFGSGDFSHVLLMGLALTQLTPAYGQDAAGYIALFYALRNVAAVVTAFPAGALSDRIGRKPLLIFGYVLGSLIMTAFALVSLQSVTALAVWAALFASCGVFIAIEEALEGAAAADLVVDPQMRGTAFGVLGVVNGVGDFISSAIVGALATVAPALGFAFAAILMALGAGLMARTLDFGLANR